MEFYGSGDVEFIKYRVLELKTRLFKELASMKVQRILSLEVTHLRGMSAKHDNKQQNHGL